MVGPHQEVITLADGTIEIRHDPDSYYLSEFSLSCLIECSCGRKDIYIGSDGWAICDACGEQYRISFRIERRGKQWRQE